VATVLAERLGWAGDIDVTGTYRVGDIRHCFADISRIGQLLGYTPRVAFADGVGELVEWVASQQAVRGKGDVAIQQLTSRGLVR
jgi:dTDP-L-rhamnose 4-epimerase